MNRSPVRAALLAALALALSVAGAPLALAASTVVLPRAGQVGFGMQLQGGTLLSSGQLGDEFGGGSGLVFRVRYRMRFERAFGLTFDAQRLNARDPSAAEGAFDSITTVPGGPKVLRDRLKLFTAGVEFFQMFDTREKTVKYLSAGAGLAMISAHLTDGDIQYPLAGDGVFVSFGAGVERFAFKSIAWDLGTRYQAVVHNGELNHDFQVQLGLIFYAAY